MINDYFKPSVQKMKGYVSPPQAAVRAKLNQNENPFDLPEMTKRRVLEQAQHLPWQRYPVNDSPAIKERLAKLYGLSPRQFLLGNGSNQLLQTLLSACLQKGDRVLFCPPTFGLFEIFTSLYDGQPCTVPWPANQAIPREEILKTLIEKKPKLVLLCSPNNPTGAEFDLHLVREISALAPGLVLIDEAYAEFSEQSFLPLLKEYQNLIISRTFSKAYSMAGLRLGYFIAHESVIAQLAKINLPYNINLLTELIACEVLNDIQILNRHIQYIKQERQRMYQQLQQLPQLNVYPSAANFLLFSHPRCNALIAFLQQHGVLIRDVGKYPFLENHARVTIGTLEENTLFYNTLVEFIHQ